MRKFSGRSPLQVPEGVSEPAFQRNALPSTAPLMFPAAWHLPPPSAVRSNEICPEKLVSAAKPLIAPFQSPGASRHSPSTHDRPWLTTSVIGCGGKLLDSIVPVQVPARLAIGVVGVTGGAGGVGVVGVGLEPQPTEKIRIASGKSRRIEAVESNSIAVRFAVAIRDALGRCYAICKLVRPFVKSGMLLHTKKTLLSVLLLALAGCGGAPEIKQHGLFIDVDGYLVEIPKLGTLGNSYGPRLYPELPEYNIPAVPYVGPIYVNVPDLPAQSLKGIEWRGYRLGGNASVGSPSTATVQDWKAVPIVVEPTKTSGVFKVIAEAADKKTGRWKPELTHEYFGLTIDGGYKGGPVWAVKIKVK
jgi:hypothetical protein